MTRYVAVCAMVLASCLPRGHVEVEDGSGGGAVGRAEAVSECAVAWGESAAGRVVVARCGLPALIPARYREARLADLVGAGAGASDDAIRATAEYRSFMDPRNVWQWGDRVSDSQALAACRQMLADLRAGQVVDWERQARGYVMHVRQADMRPAVLASGRDGVPGAGPPAGPSGQTPASRTGDRWLPTSTEPPGSPGPPGPSGSGPPRDTSRLVQPGIAGPRVRVQVRERLDDARGILDQIARLGLDDVLADTAERLATATVVAEVEAAAAMVIFAGASKVVIHGSIGAEAVTFELAVGGAVAQAASDEAIAMALGAPLLDDLADHLQEIEVLSREARAEIARHGAHATMQPALLSRDQHIAYRALIHRPMAELGRGELEHIQALRDIGQIAGPLESGTPTHKAQRWADYRASGRQWTFERWSVSYDQNVNRPNESRAMTDAHWRELGWGEREVRVEVEEGSRIWRVLDIADKKNRRAIEVKSGYVTYTAEVGRQARRDAILVKRRDWSITWHIEGRCSESVRKALRNAGITLEETHPDMPVEQVRKLYRSKQ